MSHFFQQLTAVILLPANILNVEYSNPEVNIAFLSFLSDLQLILNKERILYCMFGKLPGHFVYTFSIGNADGVVPQGKGNWST